MGNSRPDWHVWVHSEIKFRLNHHKDDKFSSARFREGWLAIVELLKLEFRARQQASVQQPQMLQIEARNAFEETKVVWDSERGELIAEQERLKSVLQEVQQREEALRQEREELQGAALEASLREEALRKEHESLQQEYSREKDEWEAKNQKLSEEIEVLHEDRKRITSKAYNVEAQLGRIRSDMETQNPSENMDELKRQLLQKEEQLQSLREADAKVHLRMLCDLKTALCIRLRPWDGIFLEHFARGLLVLPWAMEILRVLVSREFVSVWRTGLIPMEILESSDSYKVEGDYHALKWAWSLSKVWKCDDASLSRCTADSNVESDHECQPTPKLPRDLALWRLRQRCLRRVMESSATSKTCDSGQDKITLLRDELALQINCATGSLSDSEVSSTQDVGKSIDIENSLRAAYEHVREGRRFVAKAIEIANEALLLGREVYDDDWVKKMEELLERLRKNNSD
ncbi:hypothetical protein R1sor_009171 [Riccia sorocarpa]|uniref:Uncharacterized protein n=1 Tax=Riccia sorocarpa TaxID=122646 RepID=A0ABD3H4Z9_9MARC